MVSELESHSIAEIADALDAIAAGDSSIRVVSAREPADAGPSHLALAMTAEYEKALSGGNAVAAVLGPEADWRALGLKAAIFVGEPRLALAGVTGLFARPPDLSPGVHPTAIIDESAKVGDGVAVGPFVLIGAGARIADGCRICGHCSIGAGTEIGANALLKEGVRIGRDVRIGIGFISHANSVIGSDGFAYVPPVPGSVDTAKAAGRVETARPDASIVPIRSLGSVVIGDGVEIGANCAIDRGTVSSTVIGSGSKIDNLVHIAHNVRIGRNCLICGQTGFGGSAVLGDRVLLGGQVGVGDHVTIGSDVVVAGKSGISSNVPSGRIMMGNPAMKMNSNVQAYKALRRLPRLVRRVEQLEAQLRGGPRGEGD